MPKLIILILSYRGEPWETITREGQKKTWAEKEVSNTKNLFYYGDPHLKAPVLQEDTLTLPCPEGVINIGRKTLLAFQYILENFKDATHVFRTNSSAYIHIPGLLSFTEQHPQKIYSGAVGKFNGIDFVSGAGYLLSIDIIKEILAKAYHWNHNLIDDVALGFLLTKICNINPYLCPRQDACNESMLKLLNTNTFLVRIRSEGSRMWDIRALHYIHNLFKNKEYV